ncbi:MAG: glutamine--fructose-6-phosphate transaminase (isomerizing), partial [Rickettsiales bacterium]|nr:glutamine--fructose-6-phosphate transaminase (isomerizing) [Rickettsiales bacterium]
MCGIIAVCGEKDAQNILINGLELLEYRGYDSAGIALVEDKGFRVIKTKGKVGALKELVQKSGKSGTVGIAHTRWATHGEPNDANAHPHEVSDLVLVHNGVIENYADIKKELAAKGYEFKSQTDTEVLAWLIQSFVDAGDNPRDALAHALEKVKGTYAIEVIFKSEPDRIYGAKKGSPLAVGTNGRAHFMGSDAIALGHCADRIMYLEEGDSAVITKTSFEIWDKHGEPARRKFVAISVESLADKGKSEHFMQKEIFEQPEVIERAIANGQLESLSVDFGRISKIHIVACGTSYHAGLVAKYWIESLTPIWVEVEVASEFRYRRPTLKRGELAIFISQSGETADTLAALRYAKEKGQNTISIVNVATSTIARESDAALLMRAGAEVGVASTKAFT